MRRVSLLLFLFVEMLACAVVVESQQVGDNASPPYRCRDEIGLVEGKPATYSGFYEAEFEGSSFKISHSACEVWLTGDLCPIFGEGKCTKGAEVKAYVTVEGVLSSPGQFGHGGMWEREIRVTRVLKVQRIRDGAK